MAPRSYLFDPRLFCIQWTSRNLPPPVTSKLGCSAASLLGAALWGNRGCGTLSAWAAPGIPLAPLNHQGSTVLPPCFPGYQHVERQFAQLSISDTAPPTGTALGSNIPPGSDVLLSHGAAPYIQAAEDPEGDTVLPEEMLLGCSLVSQEGPSSAHMPGDPGGTGGAIPHCDIGLISLPVELVSPDYSVPESTTAILSLEQLATIGMGPQEPWWDAGRVTPPS
ncbi:proline-rich protein 22-like [Grus japonensis]|uniref:Proline-rich protein 22-like n=1 Tax=Grus japonensis TaxID=30415 RepID=A0ABC9XTH7_GRUJA